MQSTDPTTGFPTGGSSAGSNGSGNQGQGARPMIDRVASSAHQAVDKAVGVAVPAAEWLTERGQTLKQTQDQLLTDTRTYVTSNPLKAVGIALAAGLLIGRLMR
jgi:ElaB/YqjD/DUF883 family membrane-anchored ribosome-binding protein